MRLAAFGQAARLCWPMRRFGRRRKDRVDLRLGLPVLQQQVGETLRSHREEDVQAVLARDGHCAFAIHWYRFTPSAINRNATGVESGS